MNTDENFQILQSKLESIHFDDADPLASTKISLDELPARLEELKTALVENRPETKRIPLIAEWFPDLRLSALTSPPNKIVEKMGLRSSGKLYFLPEETLYLMQRGDMCLKYSNQIINTTEAYLLLGIDLHRFLVYSQLKQNGFIVANANARFKCPEYFDPSILQVCQEHDFDVWKPRPHFKVSQPPDPDFRIFIQHKPFLPKSIPEGPGGPILAFSDQGLPVFYEVQELGSCVPVNHSDKKGLKTGFGS